jgi:glycosyltransferase involved in cell wall biosynthesis
MKISLCLLVWNEMDGCRQVVPDLPLNHFDEVYAVDGGSHDGTAEYLSDQNIPVYTQPKKGLNAAYIHAVHKSTCDAVVVFFPKGTIHPACLKTFVSELNAGFDLVIASRNIPGAENEEDVKLFRIRKWGVSALAGFAALVWKKEGYTIRDVLHGVKGFSVDAFKRMKICDEGLSIDIEMVIRAYRLRLKRTEFPVKETQRQSGQTHFPLWPTAKRLFVFLYGELTHPAVLDSE